MGASGSLRPTSSQEEPLPYLTLSAQLEAIYSTATYKNTRRTPGSNLQPDDAPRYNLPRIRPRVRVAAVFGRQRADKAQTDASPTAQSRAQPTIAHHGEWPKGSSC
eukprot:993481-Pleurochrysis_carterae.AAC.1